MEKVCQSCAMPMEDESLYGTNADGSRSEDYCKYCYNDGHFSKEDETMEEMIDTCVPFMVEGGMDAGQARAILESALPTLKRWQ